MLRAAEETSDVCVSVEVSRRTNRQPRNKDVASKYFLTFYPGAEDAAASFGTSVGTL